VELARIDNAMRNICEERREDPSGSATIDEMQLKPSLSLHHPRVVDGSERAEQLLPVARALVIEALNELAATYKIEPWRARAAGFRVRAVSKIKADIELRDNASVYYHSRRTIFFGTIFLASLPSDEGIISILAHELTHIADGNPNTLQPLFKIVARRAAAATGLEIDGGRPEELTCDLVGVIAVRKYVDTTPSEESILRRLSRSIEHNCVERDETDEFHLSPRNTMRALIAVDPELARAASLGQE
jgi:hypothetical protein